MADGGRTGDVTRPPVVVIDRLIHTSPVDAPPASFVPDGWAARAGFALPDAPWDLSGERWVCVGAIEDRAAAEAALVAVTRGVGLVVELCLGAADRHRLLEDLDKLGADVGATTPPPAELPDLGGRQAERLLAALAAGSTITAAAAEIHVSRRTANRLMAEVRRRLGVATTAEAVLAWSARAAER